MVKPIWVTGMIFLREKQVACKFGAKGGNQSGMMLEIRDTVRSLYSPRAGGSWENGEKAVKLKLKGWLGIDTSGATTSASSLKIDLQGKFKSLYYPEIQPGKYPVASMRGSVFEMRPIE